MGGIFPRHFRRATRCAFHSVESFDFADGPDRRAVCGHLYFIVMIDCNKDALDAWAHTLICLTFLHVFCVAFLNLFGCCDVGTM